ncbi:MAG: rRNA pseudouridine synthase [Lachnospiraceae bacterium]|nr:rRNA pseudouridine synthase [Lachnospiraceae bacterium]
MKAREQAGPRINQYIASCGICSRREADRLIDAGRVLVNGTAATAGMRIRGTDEVTVDGKLLVGAQNKVVAAYYKPVGVTCTRSDRHADRTLEEAFSFPVRLTYAGRLDRDSEGLLLMTNDGKLIDAMMKGSAGHEKEYIVRVKSRISDADLEHFRKGVRLKELDVTTRPCKVERLGDYTFRIILTQGLNRQIRRMCKAVGNEVKKLKRVRVLTIELGALRPGEQRIISGEELAELYAAAGLPLAR